MSKKLKEAEVKVVETVKEAKSKCPKFVKWIVGIIVAIIMAAIGFFGGIFGLSAEQQNDLKKMVTSSAMYQEAVAEPVAAAPAKVEEKK